MLQTYEAILKEGRLEWSNDAPDQQQPLRVHVTVVDGVAPSETREARGQRMAEAMERLAASNPFRDITDPVAWQREIRRDKPLAGREE